MALRDYFPSFREQQIAEKKAQVLDTQDKKALTKAFKIKAIALGYEGLPTDLSKRANFEDPPYDFDRITKAIDTDSYAKNSFAKYRELFWKEGWTIVGENQEAIDYLYQRIDYMEVAMGRPFQDFLIDIADQLFRYHNVFIIKSRADQIAETFPGDVDSDQPKGPIIGYYLVPTESVQILRDKYNRPRWYRQRISSNLGFLRANTGNTSVVDPTWNANEVIHMYRDRKPGRAFGTPFLTAALDDLIALRQVEEDYLNLIHRELFPLYKYTIGDQEHPAEPDEIDQAVLELESLRTEGGLVLPFRHNVEIIGSEGKVLEISGFLNHIKTRVAVGLGVFPHHLGMVDFAGANRDMTDRLDTALYDRIKEYQRYFADCVRMFVFDELLREGGFDPMANPKLNGVSDRCIMKFNEIDVDTQVKKENHTLQKVTSNLETIGEGRQAIGRTPQLPEHDTMMAMQVRMQPDQIVPGEKTVTGGQKPPKAIDTTPSAAQSPSKGGAPNLKNLRKGSANVVRPANQHGARTSPDIRRSDDDWITEMVDLIGEDYREEDV